MRQKTPIYLAVAIGALLVLSAFFLTGLKGSTIFLSFKNEADEAKSVRVFIPVYDSDSDGLPDWQDTFVKGKINLDEIRNGGDASEETVTGKLVADLANTLTEAQDSENGNSSTEAKLQLISKNLSATAVDKPYGKEDVIIGSDDSKEAWRRYGNRVAEVALTNAVSRSIPNELETLSLALRIEDETALVNLDPLIASYQNMQKDMLAIPVPESLVKEHLSLINVYQALQADLSSFRNVFEDAVNTLLRLRRYEADATALFTAISNLYLKLDNAGIQWNESDAASRFIRVE